MWQVVEPHPPTKSTGETSSRGQHKCQGRTEGGGKKVPKSSLPKPCELEAHGEE